MSGSKAVAAGLIALFLGAIFLALFVPIVLNAFSAEQKPVIDPGVAAFATAVAGYVGGVIALWFGIPPTNRIQTLGARLLPPAQASIQVIVGYAYILAYFGVAVAGVVLWITRTALTPELLTLQATAAAGLAFAIVTKLFGES